MYEQLTKKLSMLLELAKAINKLTATEPVLDIEKDEQLRHLRAALAHAHKMGMHELIEPTQQHIDRRLAELKAKDTELKAKMGLGSVKRKEEKPTKLMISPWTMEDAKKVLEMNHDDAKRHAWDLLQDSKLPEIHKGQLRLGIHKSKNTMELAKLISDHVMHVHSNNAKRVKSSS